MKLYLGCPSTPESQLLLILKLSELYNIPCAPIEKTLPRKSLYHDLGPSPFAYNTTKKYECQKSEIPPKPKKTFYSEKVKYIKKETHLCFFYFFRDDGHPIVTQLCNSMLSKQYIVCLQSVAKGCRNYPSM